MGDNYIIMICEYINGSLRDEMGSFGVHDA